MRRLVDISKRYLCEGGRGDLLRFRLFFVPLASLFSWSRFNNSDPKILRMARWCFNHRQSYPPPTFPSSVAPKHGKGTLFMPVLLFFSLVLGPIVNPLFFFFLFYQAFLHPLILGCILYDLSLFFQRSLRTTSFLWYVRSFKKDSLSPISIALLRCCRVWSYLWGGEHHRVRLYGSKPSLLDWLAAIREGRLCTLTASHFSFHISAMYIFVRLRLKILKLSFFPPFLVLSFFTVFPVLCSVR